MAQHKFTRNSSLNFDWNREAPITEAWRWYRNTNEYSKKDKLNVTSDEVMCIPCNHERHKQGDHDQNREKIILVCVCGRYKLAGRTNIDPKTTSGRTLCMFGSHTFGSHKLDVQETNFCFAQFQRNLK